MEGGFEHEGKNNRDNDLNMTIREILEMKEKSSDDDDDLNMTINEILEMNSSLRYEEIDRELKEMKNFIEDVPSKMVEPEGDLGFQLQIDNISESGRDEETVMSSSTPPASQIAQFLTLSTEVEDFGLVSGAGMEFDRASDLLVSISVGTEETKQKIADLSFAALKELQTMAKEKHPLWQECVDGEILSHLEYTKQFWQMDKTVLEKVMRKTKEIPLLPNLSSSRCISVSHQESLAPLRSEASRHTEFLPVIPVHIVELLMDMNQYSTVFSNIVSRAVVLANLSTEAPRNYDGALQVIAVEFNAPSPLLPTRECHLARHSKQLASGIWGVVDVSLESLFPNPLIRYRRRPSGCLIQPLPNGVAKIVWVEHSEAGDGLVPEIFRPLVASGHAYGAKHWLGTLVRQCERLGHIISRSDPKPGEIVSPGRENVLRLAERMMRKFWANLSDSAENIWRPVPLKGAENVLAMIINAEDEEGQPPGTAIVIATTVWVPASPRRVFDFLNNEGTRNQWDILTYGHHVRETGHIDNGCDHGNRVSILEVKSTEDQIVAILLQESYTTLTGSYVTFAPVEASTLEMILNGGSPENVPILPSGFSILPDGPKRNGGSTGSLVTMAFQILDTASSATFIPPDSVATIFKLVTETAECIKAAMFNPLNLGT